MSNADLLCIDWEGKKATDVLDAVNKRLQNDGIEFGESDFSASLTYTDPAKYDAVIPPCRYLAVFPVFGSSEGHYIHIEAITCNGTARHATLIGTAKTWTRESAWTIARAAAMHLGTA